MGLLEGIARGNWPNVKWTLILPRGAGYEKFTTRLAEQSNISVIFVPYPTRYFRFIVKLFLDHIYTAYVFFRTAGSFLFMTANFASLLVPGRLQIVLQHNVHYLMQGNPFSSDGVLSRFKYRLEKFLFTVTTRLPARYVIQLECNKEPLISRYKIPRERIDIVTMVPLNGLQMDGSEPLDSDPESVRQINLVKNRREDIKLFFPARFYPNKNHSILLPLAEHIQKTGLQVVIFVTVDANTPFMRSVRERGLEGQVVNLGYVRHEYIKSIYDLIDGLLFPTYSESYGLPYVEALLSDVPIITSDYDFSREVCGEAALYFMQDNQPSLIETVERFTNANVRASLHKHVATQSRRYRHGWDDVIQQIFRFDTSETFIPRIEPEN